LNGRAATAPVFHHANLKTRRLNEMISWYAHAVGLEVVFQWDGGAFMTNDGANHRLALLTTPGVVDDADKITHAGIHHLAFEHATLDDLLATFTRLADDGIRPHFTVDHGMTTSFYYVDPDGNSVELQVDNFGDWTKSTEFMRSSAEFGADPIGTPVDPAQMLGARAEGATPDEVHQRGYAGEFPPSEAQDLRIPL
jgi:catechol 2,3-dioxygenase